jgi:hypothetical protein
MTPRTEGAIALLPVGNVQGSIIFLSLSSLRTIVRDQWYPLPMSQEVIDKINSLNENAKKKVSKDPIFSRNKNFIQNEENDEEIDENEGIINADDISEFRDPLEREHPGQDFIPEDQFLIDDNNISNDQELEEVTSVELADNYRGALPESNEHVIEDETDPPTLSENTNEIVNDNPVDILPNNIPTIGEQIHINEIPEAAKHYSLRRTQKRIARGFHVQHGYHLSVKKAMKTLGPEALKSMVAEMQQLLDKEVFQGVKYDQLSNQQKKKIIRSHMFLKEKFLANGSFDKLKSRFVAGGDMQDKTLYDDVSSPTASLTSVFITSLIAAHEQRHVVTVDIAGAYLNASIDTQEVLMKIDPLMSAIVCKLDPNFVHYLSDNGSLVVRLKKALYGCIESAQLWHKHLSNTLTEYGFIANDQDTCVFNKNTNGEQITVVIYVDDIMITCTNRNYIDNLLTYLEEKYKTITVNEGTIHSYLGMSLDFSINKQVKITMEGYINELLKQHHIDGTTTTPANENLFKIKEQSKLLLNDKKEEFHSIVAKLLYLAKRVRPDILVSTIFLTTRVTNPTEDDWFKLERVLKYLNGTKEIGMILSANDIIQIFAYVDAAFGCHADYKGHTGGFISLGNGPVHVKSSKQKLVTKSSTESELVGLSDYASQVIWTYYFLQSQGYSLEDPAIIYQDNKSAIALINKGRSTSERTRHINIRYFFLKDRIESKEIKIEFLPTECMIADILTKPLQGELFRIQRNKLLNWNNSN